MRSADDLGVPSRDGLVVCVSAPSCDAGASVLAQGGNAVDAAVATAFALAVTHPDAGNLGGGGFMIVRTPSGEVTTFDYRETAPLKSTQTMYLGADGKIDRRLTAAGYLAPGVPGTVRGLELAHKRFGKLPWKQVVMPAVALAEGGFRISPSLARLAQPRAAGQHGAGSPRRSRRTASRAAARGPPAIGWCCRISRRRLRAIADDGADAFYTGWIADRIAEDMEANGGLISKADLAAYQAKERRRCAARIAATRSSRCRRRAPAASR